ncbi:hypothetical protein Vadar_004180 [Vaccinium darrowii]|uniref:Uncharacterized protein n=1 Tax=Vaccinium darrowii TaxID=229202 RepID=A0ACB7YBL1_9ERIC|nr:hypothetical protein Vadar_004180 [Vaccinium darrowii]
MILTSSGRESYEQIQTKRSRDKWCKFHHDHSHETNDCIDFKQQIEDLIQRGEIVIIHGGLAGGGESNNAMKAHLRRLRTEDLMEVNTIERSNKAPSSKEMPIIFSEKDEIGVSYHHDGPLVITMVIRQFQDEKDIGRHRELGQHTFPHYI